MAHIKIDYGIDLGTTNSAICRMEKGEPVIKKTDVLKDTMPSCVSFTKKKSVKAGDSAFNDMKSDKRRASKIGKTGVSNAYVEFKRTMGTDTMYHSSNMERDYTSEELSAEVLKALKSFVTDETFNSVVITIPAKFSANQIDATKRAAKLAGFDHCELLQEPVAASMAYGLTSDEKNGYWMVFDFGGGTFDAALLKVEDGIMQVFDTGGDNYLGGKNLDNAIVDSIIVPYLRQHYSLDSTLSDENKKQVIREAMKTYAEDVKNQLSFKEREDVISNLGDLGEDEDGEEIELDLSITQSQANEVMRPYFQKAVDICKDLLKRNNMSGSQLNKLILVGGPTHSPLIRQMLKEQITQNVDTNIDPMTAVATGAALYASTIDNEVKIEDIEVGAVKLEVGFESTTVETSEWVSVRLDRQSTGMACPEKVQVELVRADKAWASGKNDVDEKGNVIEVGLLEAKANSFEVKCYNAKGNQIPCFPNEITIIQGSKVGAAPLPYNIGIATWSETKNKAVITALQGLEKNKPLPAVGVSNGLKTTKQLRPGVSADVMTIPVYQADYGFEGKTASLFEYVADVVLTGDEIESVVPEGSEIDVTLKVNSSQGMTLNVQFKAQGFDVSKELDLSKTQSVDDAAKRINDDLRSAQRTLRTMSDDGFDTASLQTELDNVRVENENSSEKKAVLQHLKEVLCKIEDFDDSTEWERMEKKLREEFERLEKSNREKGNEKTTQMVNELRNHVDKTIRTKDVSAGYELLEQIDSLFGQLNILDICIACILFNDQDFSGKRWKDSGRARQLLNQGLAIINENPTIDKLIPVCRAVLDLLPDDERGNAGGLLKG